MSGSYFAAISRRAALRLGGANFSLQKRKSKKLPPDHPAALFIEYISR